MTGGVQFSCVVVGVQGAGTGVCTAFIALSSFWNLVFVSLVYVASNAAKVVLIVGTSFLRTATLSLLLLRRFSRLATFSCSSSSIVFFGIFLFCALVKLLFASLTSFSTFSRAKKASSHAFTDSGTYACAIKESVIFSCSLLSHAE